MSQLVPGRRRRRRAPEGPAGLIHLLNQRYKEAWDRAERLQAELDSFQGSRAGRLLSWWRRLTFWRHASPAPEPFHDFPVENLDACRVAPAGQVSILIPFKDQGNLLSRCLKSLGRGSYRPLEIILIDNGSTCPRLGRTLDRLQGRRGIQVLSCPGPFNFARLCNTGAGRAQGDFLVFLNNDVEVLTPDWLERLLELGGHPRVGAVGGTLLYPDGTLQHAGIFPRGQGHWGHVYRGWPHDHPGKAGELRHARSVPAVTGACLLMRRGLFFAMNCFDEQFPVTLSDVDLCCRLRRRGLAVAVTPRARLWHYESLSRGYAVENRALSP